MLEILSNIYNNKLLFYGIIAVIAFIAFSIILIVKIKKENAEDNRVDYERIDGENSLFNEIVESKETVKTADNKLDLESMIEKMQKDLDAKASEVVEKFETEQEEKSVISYQELIGNNKDVKQEISKINVEAVLNELQTEDDLLDELNPISSVSLVEEIEVDDKKEENIIEQNISKLNMKDEFVSAIKTGEINELEKEPEKTKFKATEFVSPVYGIQDIKIQYPTVQNMKEFKQSSKNYNKFELEQTLNMEPLSEEIRRNEDFLKALKEFRKNLE